MGWLLFLTLPLVLLASHRIAMIFSGGRVFGIARNTPVAPLAGHVAAHVVFQLILAALVSWFLSWQTSISFRWFMLILPLVLAWPAIRGAQIGTTMMRIRVRLLWETDPETAYRLGLSSVVRDQDVIDTFANEFRLREDP